MAEAGRKAATVWSPETDEELMRQTIEVLERRNIIGVLSGTLERVATWRAAAPSRFIPGLQLNLDEDTAVTPDLLRSLVETGRVRPALSGRRPGLSRRRARPGPRCTSRD